MNHRAYVPVTQTTIYLVPLDELEDQDSTNLEWQPPIAMRPQYGITQMGVSAYALANGADPSLWDWPES